MNGKDQYFWNFIFSVLFLFLVAGAMYLLHIKNDLPREIPLFDAMLIALATFRGIRLFVYDKITAWLRHFFFDTTTFVTDGGVVVSKEVKPMGGPRRTAADLFGCPWCFGVWIGFFLTFFYFYIPEIAWFVILVLALSGLATFVQLLTNMVGWRAEELKQKVAKKD